MARRDQIAAAFRDALGGAEPAGLAVQMGDDGEADLVIVDLSVEEDDDEACLDAFQDAYQPTLLRLARQQGGPAAALRILVLCGAMTWSPEQNPRKDAVHSRGTGPRRGRTRRRPLHQ